MAHEAKPMSGNKLASIIMALGNAYDYGIAASMNADTAERTRLEELMLSRLQAAIENAGLELVPEFGAWKWRASA